MTQEDLSRLDEELKSGYVSDEEYVQILKDEVSRIHPEFEDYEIENMIRIQLKANAIEESLVSELSEIPDRPEMSSIPQAEKCNKDCDQHECNSSQQDGELNPQENTGRQEAQQESGHSEKQETTKEDSGHNSSDKESESGKSDKRDDENNRQNDNNKNDKKDKSKGGGNRAWVTYQIVPEWVLFGDNTEDNKES